jgi:hypothetical protein
MTALPFFAGPSGASTQAWLRERALALREGMGGAALVKTPRTRGSAESDLPRADTQTFLEYVRQQTARRAAKPAAMRAQWGCLIGLSAAFY